MSFATLKKQSNSVFEKLTKEVEKISNPESGSGADERLWKPEMDKSGNGYAVIRFLPAPEGEDIPWAKVWSHAFQGPGGWYIENSLTTLNKKDPVGEMNRQLWNSGSDTDKEIARKQKRKLSYYANIYVVEDPAHPENEGRVFLYKFGKKIFDKIMAAMQPEFKDETPINPFDFWQGADFKVKIRKVDGYWNYDKSEFSRPGTLGNFSDDELEAIWKKEYSLTEFTDEKNFKTFEELEARLNQVLNSKAPARRTVDRETEEDEIVSAPSTPSSWSEEVSSFRSTVSAAPSLPNFNSEDEDDDLSYFARLAEED
jgi:gp32 DNA binding protein like